MAVNEARRCLLCTEPPCNEGCPAGVDVRRFVGAVATGDFVEAIKALYEKNVLPLSCAYICPAERQCIERCRHTELNFPVMIHRVQEWVSRYALEGNIFRPKSEPDTGRRVAVIGGGPSGLAAAARLRQKGFRATIFERTDALGGMLRHCVPVFRLPREALDMELEVIRQMGVEFKTGTPVTDAGSLLNEGFEAAYIATGLWQSAPLDLQDGSGRGTHAALPFLSDCVSGDPATYGLGGKRVVIVGGGSVAMDVSANAVRLGARTVTLATLESPAEIPAAPDEIARAWSDGVIFESRVMPLRIVRDNGALKGLEAVRIEWREPGIIHPSNAVKLQGSEFVLPADVVFLAIGQRPDAQSEKLVSSPASSGPLPTVDDETMMTSRPGIFAGGDLVNGGGTAAQAIAEGVRAAEGMMSYLSRGR